MEYSGLNFISFSDPPDEYDFGIVVVTVSKADFIARILDSIARSNFDLTRVKIVVVDNGPIPSQEVKLLCQARAHYRWLGAGINVSKARNVGWTFSLDCTYVLFVDDDNEFLPQSLNAAWKLLEISPKVGAVAPVSLLGATQDIWCGGVTRSSWSGRTRFIRALPIATPKEGETSWATIDLPNCFAVRTKILVSIDGFDDVAFPMHREEADLAMRIRRLGWELVVQRDFIVRHHTTETLTLKAEVERLTQKHGRERLEYWARARPFFHRRHSSGIERLLVLWIGIPIWLLLVIIETLRSKKLDRLSALGSIVRGIYHGYHDHISRGS